MTPLWMVAFGGGAEGNLFELREGPYHRPPAPCPPERRRAAALQIPRRISTSPLAYFFSKKSVHAVAAKAFHSRSITSGAGIPACT